MLGSGYHFLSVYRENPSPGSVRHNIPKPHHGEQQYLRECVSRALLKDNVQQYILLTK